MTAGPDFRVALQPLFSPTTFYPLEAHNYYLSLRPLTDQCERWEVAVFDNDGRFLTPDTAPYLFTQTEVTQHWASDGIGHDIPTNTVQLLYRTLLLGDDPATSILHPSSCRAPF